MAGIDLITRASISPIRLGDKPRSLSGVSNQMIPSSKRGSGDSHEKKGRGD